MRIIKSFILSIPYSIALVFLWFSISSILRIRPNPYVGKSIKAISGKDRDNITLEDLLHMNRDQLVGIFHQLPAPGFEEMHGEFKALILDVGNPLMQLNSDIYLNRLWGRWIAKAFEPAGENRGHGYNVFRVSERAKTNEDVIPAYIDWTLRSLKDFFMGKADEKEVRIIRNKTRIGDSIYDNRKSFHLEYHDYTPFPTSTMKDEVRKLNDNLYLSLGILTISFGKRNICPFVLIGPPAKWVGPDEGYQEG